MAWLAVGLYLATPAQAATLVVNSSGHGTAADCNGTGTAFTTIGAAYTAAAAGDTIFVCPGTYPEHLTISKPVTLEGAQAGVGAAGRTGPEAVMDAPDGDLLITVPGVTVDGFTFHGQVTNLTQEAAVTATTGGVTVVNDIFSANSGAAVLVDGTGAAGPPAVTTISDNVADSGISLASVTAAAVTGNEVVKPTAPGYALRLPGGDTNVVVTGNWFVGGLHGILVQNTLATPNSGITVTGNCIAGNSRSGLTVDAGGTSDTVEASANWWGSVNGPSGTGPGWGDAWVDPGSLISASTFLVKPRALPCPQLPSMSIVSPPPITEGHSGTKPLDFTVRLSAPYVARTRFAWATTAGTAKAGSDFTAAGGTVVIPAGKRTATVTVRIVGDAVREATKHFTVVIGSPVNATVAHDTATATVLDGGTLPATGPGSSGGFPVGGIATGLGPARSGAHVLSYLLLALGLAAALLAAVDRLRGGPSRRTAPAAGIGCMAAIAAIGLLLAGGHATMRTPVAAAAALNTAAPASSATGAHPRPPKPPATHQQQDPQPPPATVSTPPPLSPPPPRVSAGMQIAIPAIGVDAGVLKLGLNPDSTLQVPSTPSAAGWWSGGTRPGQVGPAVIVGHVNWGGVTGVFGRLGDLRRGDQIRVRQPDGAVDRYVVTRTAVVPKSRFPTRQVYGTIGYAGLRLVTCTGSFDSATGHYVDNLIVFARMTGRSA